MTTTTTFEIGNTYATRAVGDHTMILSYTVIKRTAKFMTVVDRWGKERRCGISSRDGFEYAMPEGRHAWAPMIYSHREA